MSERLRKGQIQRWSGCLAGFGALTVSLCAVAMRLPSVYDAVWITGTLRTQIKNSQLGTAAYTLDATKVEKYDFEPR
ncbi:MAG TPA: DUF3299 domain-containing protein [Steroidobacteraceae bacterium]|nr:DUF3299 domain-containing protein [Steroidobacteraceae bacterium]